MYVNKTVGKRSATVGPEEFQIFPSATEYPRGRILVTAPPQFMPSREAGDKGRG